MRIVALEKRPYVVIVLSFQAPAHLGMRPEKNRGKRNLDSQVFNTLDLLIFSEDLRLVLNLPDG